MKVGPKLSRLLEAIESGNLSSNDTNLYDKLSNNDWFRVLVIVPGEFDSPIIAWLKTFRRENINGQYEAFSYNTFDEVDSKTCKVECNHKVVSVNQSLGVALRYLRRPASYRVMWIDGLCINQDDLEERSQQVQVMSQIYNQALRTIVWLGTVELSNIINGFSLQ